MAGKTGTAVFAAACGIIILFIGRYPMAAKAKPEKRTISLYSVDKKAVVEAERVHKSDGEWKKLLTPEQFRIARKKGTERAFTGEYHDSKGTGTYRCVCCGTDLFSSEAKYDSGTGWPSFREPVSELNVRYESDRSLFTERTEVLCARCDAHLGHVFDDGPLPTRTRFCMNSASLVFAPR